MIPILFEKDETAFISNGLGRLRDTIEARVVEERNGIYELDFSYPLTGVHFNEIQVGRIVAVTHDETGDLEPFDIVSYSKPINGVVEFHCVHISYRLSYMTVTASSVNSLADAFTAFESAEPSMPFSFQTDKTSTGYAAAFNGLPQSVRSLMGGIEGSLLDTYGGEYAFNNWTVYLYAQRGQQRDFSIRYGVNMLDYNEDVDSQGAFSSCMPYWTDGTDTVLGDRVDSGSSTITGRGECVPLDLSDKFETQPTKAQVEAEALSYMTSNNTFTSKQTISVDFVRLQDMGYEDLGALMECKLCDSINVIFPDYNTSGWFKIVRTEWDVLADRYVTMELGSLSVSLSEALGISNDLGGGGSGSGQFLPLSGGTLTGALDIQSTLDVSGNTAIGGTLTLGGHSSAVGSMLSKDSSHDNGTADAWVTGPSVTLTPGTWILFGIWTFASLSSTNARVCAARYQIGTNYAGEIRHCMGTSYQAKIEPVWFAVVTQNTTVSIQGMCSRATATASSQYIRAMRIV